METGRTALPFGGVMSDFIQTTFIFILILIQQGYPLL